METVGFVLTDVAEYVWRRRLILTTCFAFLFYQPLILACRGLGSRWEPAQTCFVWLTSLERTNYDLVVYLAVIILTAMVVVPALRDLSCRRVEVDLDSLPCSQMLVLVHNYLAWHGALMGTPAMNLLKHVKPSDSDLTMSAGVAALFRWLGCALAYAIVIVSLLVMVRLVYEMGNTPYSYDFGRTYYTRSGFLLVMCTPYLSAWVIVPMAAYIMNGRKK